MLCLAVRAEQENTSFCNLAVVKKSTYIDCDVEEPNGHLFLNLHYQGEGNINKNSVDKRYVMVAVSVLNFAIITRLPMQKISNCFRRNLPPVVAV